MTHNNILRMSKTHLAHISVRAPTVSLPRRRTPLKITKDTFHSFLNDNKDTLSVVNIHHHMCSPCRQVVPKVEEWCNEYDDYAFGFLEYDKENKALLQHLGVFIVPTVQVYNNNIKIMEVTGVSHLDKVRQFLNMFY